MPFLSPHSVLSTSALQMPLVQACFEGNVVTLTELIGQREDVNAVVCSLFYKLAV